MSIFNIFKIREPVLSLVSEVLSDPSKHKLTLVSDNQIILHFRGEANWRIGIAHHGIWMWKSDNIDWMTERESRYVYNSIRHLYDDANMTREGWLKKVNEEK